MRLKITGGRLIDPATGVDRITDLYVANNKVAAIGAPPDSFEAEREIDARGRIVCPGLIDLRARLREPGQEHKATIASETRAAAAAGITTLCCPPDTDPVIDSPSVVELIRRRAGDTGCTRVLPVGALTQGLKGEQLAEMYTLIQAGCIAVGNAQQAVANTLVMRRALEYAASLDLLVMLSAEDPWLGDSGCVHEGAVSARLGLAGIPTYAETVAVGRELMLIEQTGARAHFCQLSSARAVEMVMAAQQNGLPVTADVSAHQLYLTEMDVDQFNGRCHVRPPLRTQRDRDALRRAVGDGALGAVCSDHQPHDLDAKLAPFASSEPGISALETLLPLTLRLVDEKLLGLSEAIARLTSGPAGILDIDTGHLRPGARADICIFDPEQRWSVEPEALVSRGKNTPFGGWEMRGRVTHTLLDGRIVFELAP